MIVARVRIFARQSSRRISQTVSRSSRTRFTPREFSARYATLIFRLRLSTRRDHQLKRFAAPGDENGTASQGLSLSLSREGFVVEEYINFNGDRRRSLMPPRASFGCELQPFLVH